MKTEQTRKPYFTRSFWTEQISGGATYSFFYTALLMQVAFLCLFYYFGLYWQFFACCAIFALQWWGLGRKTQ